MPPFEYKPFVNPYIGSISALMGKRGDVDAEAVTRIGDIQAADIARRGQAWGSAVEGLGNIAGKAFTDYASPEAQDRREAEKARAIFNDMRKAETQTTNGVGYRNFTGDEVPAELTRSELSFDRLGNPKVGADGELVRTEVPGAAAVAAISGRQGLPTVTRSHPYRKLADVGVEGLDIWDIDAVNKNFAENDVSPELAFKYTQIMRASNDDMEKHHANAMDIMRKNAYDILQFSPDARLGAAQQLLEKYQNNGVLSYKDLQGARQQLDSIAALPEEQQAVSVSRFLLSLSGERPTLMNVTPGSDIVNLETGGRVATGGAPTLTPAEAEADALYTPPEDRTLAQRAIVAGMQERAVLGRAPVPPPPAGSDASRVGLEVELFTTQNGRPPSTSERLAIERSVANERPPSVDTAGRIGGALQLTNSLKSHPAYVQMIGISNGFDAVKAGIEQANGAGDIAVINALQRMIDPGVSVREGDVALLQSAQPFLAGLRAMASSTTTGSKFDPTMRADVLRLATALMAARAAGFNESVGRQYRAIADRYGIPYELVGQDFEVPPMASPGGRPVTPPRASAGGGT
jgi:hypothetical protein